MASSEATRKSTISLSILHLEHVCSCAATFCYLSIRRLITGALFLSGILTSRKMVAGKRKAPVAKSSPAIIQYLAAVDKIKSSAITDNAHSLLQDVTHTKDSKFFDSLVFGDSGEMMESTLDEIAEDKIAFELNTLYEEYTFATAKDASLTDDLRRDMTHQHSENSLVYGEIEFKSFQKLLQCLPPPVSRGEGIFYDIGSGSGRAVFTARFTGDFDRCVGIELLPNLHQLAASVNSLYKILYRHKLKWQTVEFHCADLMEYDWSDGTVVYAPSLLFDDEMMAYISNKAKDLQQGAYLISLKKFAAIDPTAFEMIQEAVFPMSWGSANVYVYRRC
jgi:hypothetical protein